MRVLVSLLLLAFAVALAPLEKCTQEKAEDNHYIVRFYPHLSPDCGSIGAVQAWASKTIGGGNVTSAYSFGEFRGFAAYLNRMEIQSLRKMPEILMLEEDCVFRIPEGEYGSALENHANRATESVPELPGWGQHRSDQNTHGYSTAIPFNPAGDGSSASVYVLDTGILTTHEQFGGRAVFGASFIPGQTGDGNGHGTHCAGTIGGAINNIPSAGYVEQVRLVAVKVLSNQGSGATTGIVDGINWVINNRIRTQMSVISMSLGGGASTSMDDACNNAANQGIAVVVAAGNSNADGSTTSPCRAANTICVAATDANNNFASFTNFGSVVDIAAPGVSIKSAWYTCDTCYNTISGTSMACPAVAGQVVIWAQLTDAVTLLPSGMRQALQSFGTKNTVLNYGSPKTLGGGNLLCYDRWDKGPSL
jgi:subtilisin family serine protease